ncbi:MAG: hypothetical protein LUE93_00545 [Bacteroides sp.]|nr:hypothetical protein [Bacteroides sp.]
MKKDFILLFTPVLLFIVAGCASMQQEAELYFPESDPVSVKEAEVYFNSFIRTFVLIPDHALYSRGKEEKGGKEPILAWNKAEVVEYYGDLLVEIPVERLVMAIRNTGGPEKKDSIATDTLSRRRPPNTVLKLIARKDGAGELDFQVVRITATDEYLQSIEGKINRMRFSTLRILAERCGTITRKVFFYIRIRISGERSRAITGTVSWG